MCIPQRLEVPRQVEYEEVAGDLAHWVQEQIIALTQPECFRVASRDVRRSDDHAMNKSSAAVEDNGPISSYTLPAGWVKEGPSPGGFGARNDDRFHPPGDANTTVSTGFRGSPLTSDSANAFRQTLKHAHVLMPNELRILSDQVFGLLGDNQYAIPFEKRNETEYQFRSEDESKNTSLQGRYAPSYLIREAYTCEINGKMVLVLQADSVDKYGRVQDTHVNVLVDEQGNGKFVHEINFESSARNKRQYLRQFQDSLKTITWK